MKKSYAFKRTLAGVLAVLTVAAYVPANVGAFKAAGGFGLTASADDSVVTQSIGWTGLGNYLTKIEGGSESLGSNTLTKTNSWPFEKDKEIKVVSSVPLDMHTWSAGRWTTSTQDTDYANGAAYKMEVSSNETVFTYHFILKADVTLAAATKEQTIYNVSTSPKNGTTNVITNTLKPITSTFATDQYIEWAASKKELETSATVPTFSSDDKATLTAAGMKTKRFVAAQVPFTVYSVSKKTATPTTYTRASESDPWGTTGTPGTATVSYEYVDSYASVYDSTLMLYVAEVEIPYLKDIADTETIEGNKKIVTSTTVDSELYLSDTNDTAKASFKESNNKLLGDGNGMQNAVVASILGKTTNDKQEPIDLDNNGVVENGKTVTISFDAIKALIDDSGTRSPKVTVKKDGVAITSWDDNSFTVDGSSKKVTADTSTFKTKTSGGTDWSNRELDTTNAGTAKRYGLLARNVKDDVITDVNSDSTYDEKDCAVGDKFITTEPGKYDVELAVYVEEKGNILKKTISYSFTIKAKDALTAENIKIKLDMPDFTVASTGETGFQVGTAVSKTSDGVYYLTNSQINGLTANKKKTIQAFGTPVKDSSGIIGYEVVDDSGFASTPVTKATTQFKTAGATSYFAKSNGVVDITVPADYDGSVSPQLLVDVCTLNKTSNNMEAIDGWAEKNQFDVVDIRSLADVDIVNRMTVQIYDSEFGGSKKDPKEVVVKWRLSKAGENSVYKFAEDSVGQAAKKDGVVCSIDEVDSLKGKIFDAIVLKQYSVKDFTFGYLPGEYSLNTNTMDDLNTGLPTEKGTYTVFFIVDDQSVATIKVVISGKMIRSAIPSAQLTKTFGEKLDFKGFYFKDADGKKVTDIKQTISYTDLISGVYPAVYVTNPKTGENTDELELEKDGSYKKGTEIATWNQYALAPGKYIVETKSMSVDNDTYTIGKKQYVVTVNKKKLTADMVTAPTFNVGSTHTVTADNFICKFKDAYENEQVIPLKITTGDTSKSAAGEYTVHVEASTASKGMTDTTKISNPSQKPSDYLVNNIEVNWHICKNGTILSGLAFDEEATTLYDAGRIHFEVNRKDNVNGTIKRFGIVLDKQGKLPADAKTDAAEAFLQVGNGLVEGEQGDKQKGTTKYGVNIKVVNVETGIWARPYIETTDGTLYYGKPIYRNITDEATDKLKLTFANNSSSGLTPYNKTTATKFESADSSLKTYIEAKTKASINNAVVGDSAIQCGYDKNAGKYYLYSSMQKLNSSVKANVQQSGVVYDKFGLIGKDGKLVSDPTVTADKALTLANGVNAEDIKAGQKVIGIGKAKANNTVLSGQEYGAFVTPADGISGVWARAYVKLSDSLIIYTDPVYIESLSDHYTFAAVSGKTQIASGWTTHMNTTTGAAEFSFKIIPGVDGLTMKSCGVVADRFGEFLSYNAKTQKYELTSELKEKASKALLVGSTYRVGSVSSVTNNTYSGAYTPKVADNGTIRPVVARPFITFTTKDGNEITIYGEVKPVQTASQSLVTP